MGMRRCHYAGFPVVGGARIVDAGVLAANKGASAGLAFGDAVYSDADHFAPPFLADLHNLRTLHQSQFSP